MRATWIIVLLCASVAAHAQAPTRVRGTISAVEGNVLSVKSRDGRDLTIELAADARIATPRAIALSELKPGTYVGTTAKRGADGRLVALEVHTIPPQAPAGHMPWDLEPGSTMTNANLAGVTSAAGGNEITLQYPGGSQTILVPAGTPVVTSAPAERSALRPGEYVFVIGRAAADGRITATSVTVSRDGVRPPQ